MKHLLKRFLIVTFFMGVMNHVFSQGLTITGTVEANDLTISGTVNVGSLTATGNVGILGNLYVAQSFQPANIITAGSLTATGTIKSQAISVAGTIAGGALSITNSGIVGGALSVIGAFSAGSMQIATVTGNTGFLQLRQLNDTYGESGVYIYNRNGSNGPIFYTGNNVDLVDLGYLSLTSNSQFNMRFEHRNTSVVNTGNSTVGEFQMFNTKQNGTDVGTAFAAFGPVTSSMTSTLLVTGAISAAGITSTALITGTNIDLSGTGNVDGLFTAGALSTTGSVTAGNLSTTTTGDLDVGTGGITNWAGLTMTGTIVTRGLSSTSYYGMRSQQDIQQLTGSGTYIVPAGVFVIEVEMVGGGGAGGGAITNTGATSSGGGGGGGGAYLKEIVYVSPGQNIAYSVGAAKPGTHAAAGTAGNNTTFGSLTANGGSGGTALANGTTATSSAGGAGGTATAAVVISMGGTPVARSSATFIVSGSGGNTPLGKGGEGITISNANTNFAGNAGTGFGSGGGGGVAMRTSSNQAAIGGAGAAGTIIVREMK